MFMPAQAAMLRLVVETVEAASCAAVLSTSALVANCWVYGEWSTEYSMKTSIAR